MEKNPHLEGYGIIPAGVLASSSSLSSPLQSNNPKRSKRSSSGTSTMLFIGMISLLLLIQQNLLLFKHTVKGKYKLKKDVVDVVAVDDNDDRIDINTIDFTWSSLNEAGDSKNNTIQPMIAYVTQGKAESCLLHNLKFQRIFEADSYVFICHSYDKQCGHDDSIIEYYDGGNFLCIHQPNTTFAEGKNIIIRALVGSSAWWSRIKYAVSFDDDAPLYQIPFGMEEKKPDFGVSWYNFHDLLLNPNTTHPLIKPQYHTDYKDRVTTYQTCTDDNFWAIRKDHLPVIYPFSTIGKQYHWTNAYRVWFLLHKCYPHGFQVLHSFVTDNPNHRFNVTDYKWPVLFKMTVSMLQDGYPTLGPWEWGMYPIHTRCDAHLTPSIGLHPTCKDVMVDRFQNWIDGKYHP